jgi:hypothetical protein
MVGRIVLDFAGRVYGLAPMELRRVTSGYDLILEKVSKSAEFVTDGCWGDKPPLGIRFFVDLV